MERSNQPTKPECCRREGQASATKAGGGAERPVGGVPREIREPQAGVAPRLSNSASKPSDAGGQDILSSESEIRGAVKGEASRSLPGSKSVAREEGTVRNQGDPVFSRRTNYEGQVGREVQRRGGPTERTPGVGSLHSSSRQGASPERSEGGDRTTQPAQATSAVGTTEQSWPTFLRAIADKARRDRNHRFGDLYRQLNQESLRASFYLLRKEAASGVDGVTFQEYEKHLEANLAQLVERLKSKSYHARLVRRKYIPKGHGKLRPLGIPTVSSYCT